MRHDDTSLLGDTSPAPLTRYLPRHFRFLGVTELGGLRIKLYSIRCDSAPLTPEILEAVESFLQSEFPRFVEVEGDHHELGFAILHEGKASIWLLMDWWAHADILCQRMAHTNNDGRFAVTDRPFHGCVWEGVIIAHEHRAWVESMLTDAPDPERYLGAVLPDGSY